MIITIDGPAGTGKSTMARQLAEALGYQFLDTGALYRAIAWLSLQKKMDVNETEALAEMALNAKIEIEGNCIKVNDRDITREIRSAEVTKHASVVAVIPTVREILTKLQRNIAAQGDIVTEGRDQGTVVFPQAECKFYITASKDVRALRRQRDLEQQGQQIDYQAVLADIEERDQRDQSRVAAPLKPAADAIILDTSALAKAEVLETLIAISKKQLKKVNQLSQ